MRMSYRMYPTDYVQELNQKGLRGRVRAMAFMSYWNDLEFGEHQSISFYAKAWSVSKSTAWEWVQEFKEECDKFLAHWELKNNRQYISVKKSTERTERTEPNEPNGYNNGVADVPTKEPERTKEPEPNQVFNINTITNAEKRLFDDLFFIYSQNTQYPGKKSEALDAYIKVMHDAKHNDFKRAIFFYLHDAKHNFAAEPRLFNMKNFFDEGAYLSYIPKHIKIKNRDTWLTGVYNPDNNVFTSTDGSTLKLYDEVFKKKFANGELEFIRETTA